MPQLKRPLVACLAACSISAWAQDNVATLRAVGPHVSDKIIRYVAVNAEPTGMALT